MYKSKQTCSSKIKSLQIVFLMIALITFFTGMNAQNLVVEGGTQLLDMVEMNNADSVVVLLSDGTLAFRNAATITNHPNQSPWYLGKDTLDGIVFYIYTGSDGQEHGLIVSKIETLAAWSDSTILVGANRSWDGDYNTNLMTYSPAKDWITANFSSDWYLPSVDELAILWNNRFHVNKAMHDNGHILIDFWTYLSSVEYSSSGTRVFELGSGDSSLRLKSIEVKVRAIRAF